MGQQKWDRALSPARLELEIQDRFGNPVKPKEWFLVLFQVIDQIVERIRDRSITGFTYDLKKAALVPDREMELYCTSPLRPSFRFLVWGYVWARRWHENDKNLNNNSKRLILADGEGFEPPVGVNPRRFSRPVP